MLQQSVVLVTGEKVHAYVNVYVYAYVYVYKYTHIECLCFMLAYCSSNA